jgi:hypothetical protein
MAWRTAKRSCEKVQRTRNGETKGWSEMKNKRTEKTSRRRTSKGSNDGSELVRSASWWWIGGYWEE